MPPPSPQDKLVEIAYLNENIAGTAMASSYGGQATPSGNFLADVMTLGRADGLGRGPGKVMGNDGKKMENYGNMMEIDGHMMET